MVFLVSLLLAVLFAFLCRKPLKKMPYLFYGIAVVLSLVTIFGSFQSLPRPLYNCTVALLARGGLATALWCVVMWTGALKNGSKAMKALMPVRGELSIFTAILTLGHNIGYGRVYFVRLFTAAGRMTPNQIAASLMTIVMLLIMLPLTVLSFPQVRRRMKPKRWKQLQRSAYLFYALIYCHVMTLFLPYAREGKFYYRISILLYSVVFIGYAVCRVRKYLLLRKKTENRRAVNAAGAAAFVLLTAAAVWLANPLPASEIETVEVAASEEVSEPVSAEESEISSAESEEESKTSSAEELAASSEEPATVYLDGSYTASAFGYDGDITVTLTIEHDSITALTASTDESDPWYLEEAEASVIPQILSTQSTQVDVVSGATYTSNAIMKATDKALESARR